MSITLVYRRLLRSVLKIKLYNARQYSSTAGNFVETEKLGAVFLINLNRPEKRNCVNQATALQLTQAFKQFDQDDSLNVAILYGKGGNFCAGYDLEELANISAIPSDASQLEKGTGPMGASRQIFNKPVIAAVTGYAVAGGLELSLMCDMRIAEEGAIFGVFCRRYGVPLVDGGTVRLPHLIGLSRALDLILTGRQVNAKEGVEMGLVNRVVTTGAVLGEAMKIAQTLSSFPQQCMRADRRSAYYAAFEAKSFQQAIDNEYNSGIGIVEKESKSGAARFMSARKASRDAKNDN